MREEIPPLAGLRNPLDYHKARRVMTIDQTPRVSLISLGREHEATFQNLIQLYTHDFSEFWADTRKGDVQANGRFADYPLSDFWERPGSSANLILIGSTIAGFSLVNNSSHISEAVGANARAGCGFMNRNTF